MLANFGIGTLQRVPVNSKHPSAHARESGHPARATFISSIWVPAFAALAPLPLLIEVSQIGRLLALPDRHQQAILSQDVVLVGDDDMMVVLGAVVLDP